MNNSQYIIDFSVMDQFYIDVCNKTQNWYEQLENWRNNYTKLIRMDSFCGESAEAVKSYLGEVHEVLLQSIYTAISRFQTDYLLYKNGYGQMDSDIYAVLSQETIASVERRLGNEVTYLNHIHIEIISALNSVRDIYVNTIPNKNELENQLNTEKNKLFIFNNNIENYEHTQYNKANGELRNLLEALEHTINVYNGQSNSIQGYTSGSLCNQTEVLDLYKEVQISLDYMQDNKEEIELATVNQQQIFAQLQEDYEKELADKRMDEGGVKLLIGASAVIVGGAAIILTAGAATPIVITAAVAGTWSVSYGVSNMIEGGQDVYYGAIGELDAVSVNPIKDTIFGGNQEVYDVWGNLSMTVAGLCIPTSQAINSVAGASNSVIAKKVAITITKETIIEMGANAIGGTIANCAQEEFGWSKTFTTAVEMGLSFGLEKGAEKVLPSKFTNSNSFAEDMTYEEALKYNNYWENIETGNQTGYVGLTDADITAWKLADAKLNEQLAVNKVDNASLLELRKQEANMQSFYSEESISVNQIISQVESGELQLETAIQKGNYGEMKMDIYFENMKYERISIDRVTDINEGTRQGIDGVYYNPDGELPYIIAEAKYDTSKLGNTKDGKQMSDTWIEGSNRLEKAVGKELADEILFEGYEKILIHVESDGKINKISFD